MSVSFVKLTAPDDKPVYVAPTWVIKFRETTGDDLGLTRIDHSGGVQFVTEPVNVVAQILQYGAGV